MGSSKSPTRWVPHWDKMGETSPGPSVEADQLEKPRMKRLVAKTLNQGQGETCTIHALANALTQSLWQNSYIEISPEECLGGLKQLEKVEVFGGNHVEDFHGLTVKNMTDQITGAYGNVQIHVTRGKGKGGQYVLVYDLVEGAPETDKHCVYIRGVSSSDRQTLSCVNSWGSGEDENPELSVLRKGNIFYCIHAKWIPLKRSPIEAQSGENIIGRVTQDISGGLTLTNVIIIFGRVVQSMFRDISGKLTVTNAIYFTIILFGKVVRLNFVMKTTAGGLLESERTFLKM